MTTSYNDVRATTFEMILRHNMIEQHNANPARYQWPVTEAPVMAKRMLDVAREGSVNMLDIKGPALSATIKALQIKPTYAALKDYLTGGNAYLAKKSV